VKEEGCVQRDERPYAQKLRPASAMLERSPRPNRQFPCRVARLVAYTGTVMLSDTALAEVSRKTPAASAGRLRQQKLGRMLPFLAAASRIGSTGGICPVRRRPQPDPPRGGDLSMSKGLEARSISNAAALHNACYAASNRMQPVMTIHRNPRPAQIC